MSRKINKEIKESNLGYFNWMTLILIVFSGYQSLQAQSNLKAGYVFSYYDYSLFEKTIKQKNADLSEDGYTELLGLMKLGHGVEMGYRRRFGDLALDLSYSISFAGSSAQIDEIESTVVDLRRRHHGFKTGLESYFGSFGLGAAAQYNWLRLSGRLGTNSYESLDTPKYFNVRLYLMLILPGNESNSISLQPFIDVPIASDHNLDRTAALLETTSQGSGKIPLTFGIKLIIYNGQQ